ncbi:MAG: hypothetical protein Q4C42_05165 [Clostridia bacterium]|nr:hypothetical protein [Clostridia bacterium]
MLISLKEYCLKHGKDPATGRQRVARGAFKTAVKMGRDWFIEEDEPWIDYRMGTNSKRWKKDKE